MDESAFCSVYVSFDAVEWNNGANIDTEVLRRHARKRRRCVEVRPLEHGRLKQ